MIPYTDSTIMENLMKISADIQLPVAGSLIEGTVISVSKNKALVDIDGVATGIISGQEAYDSSGTLKTLAIGDTVSAYVLDEEDDSGLVVLSLRRASQQKTWTKFIDAYENNTVITVSPNEANKGGLLLNIDGIKGFIPVSQLAPLHYPRVNGADSNEIFTRLQKLIGIPLDVKIINLDREGGKLILSEKAAEKESREKAFQKLQVGEKVVGKISGIVNFGIFVTFDGLEGLVHISEIAWGHVKDPNDYGKLGDEVEVLVIGKDKDKISLSMKRLIPDPWIEAAKKYKVGTEIEGQISRVTPFGIFIKLDDEINGLIHISEITTDENAEMPPEYSVGKTIKAKVIAIDPDDHRVGLSIKAIGKDIEEVKNEGGETAEEKAEEGETKKTKKATKAKKEEKEEEAETEEEEK